MYKLLLVDDKVDSIEAISKLIDWERLKVRKVIIATNGKEAIDKVFEDMPDIVITDIKMPIMNGLELAEEIKKINDNIVTIILSGYDEFSFAQKALKLGVKEYLLKPVSMEDIERVVKNSVEFLDNKKNRDKEKGTLETQIETTEKVLKAEYLNRLVKTPTAQIDLLKEQYKCINIDIDPKNLIVVVIYIDGFNKIINTKTPKELDTMMFALENIFINAMSKYKYEIFKTNENELCLILSNNENKNIKLFLQELESEFAITQDLIKDILNITVTIGIGKWVRTIDYLNTSYKNASDAIKYRIIKGKNSIINSYRLDGEYLDSEKNYFNKVEKIINLFKRAQYRELMQVLEIFWMETKKQDSITPMEFKSIMIQILILTNTVLLDYGIDSKEFRKSVQDTIVLLDTYSSRNDIEESIAKCFKLGTDLILDNKSYIGRLDVDRALKYIEDNFRDSISLKQVANYINLSPSYLSMLIKEYTGENFKEILVKYRMEEAKKLLGTNNYKVYEVASMVGYNDRRHFSDIFKKYTGFKPTEYKEKNI